MLSANTKRKIFRIIPFGVIWLLFSIIYTLVEKGLLGPLTYYPTSGVPYSFDYNIISTPSFAVFTGLFLGSIEILYFNKLFAQKKFIQKIIYKTIIYLFIIVLFLVTLSVTANSIQLQTTIFNARVWHYTSLFLFTFAFLSIVIYIASIIGFSLFYNEVSDNLGQGVLVNFLTGKYHSPTEEERIFMFLDMKSSTAIAEKLGHVRYFEMLREYYSDLSDPIINYQGEIYQYVGDEIVVSWKLQNGLRDNNCIRCFFAMKAALQNQKSKYMEHFGLLPEFKAGFHAGKVTTGEIGALKKEIIFTGDVLNTTARIQGLCNSYKVNLLVSDHLVQQLHLDELSFHIKTLGETELRGRDERVKLVTVELV